MAANAAKTDAEVIIDGKVYTISGLESEEYIQKVASYLNGKLAELRKSDSYMRLSPDYRNVLLQLNIADDYFRMQQEKEEIRQDSATREKDLYDLKHELIATQMKLEKAEKDRKALREKNNENEKSVIRLETELKTRKDDKRI